MSAPPTVPVSDWRTSVSVVEDVELANVLIARLPPANTPRSVSVTDLVAPRRAFWRAFSPVELTPERQERVAVGRSVHRRLGIALSREGALEVRARRGGIVGRIDLLSDVPVEVKSTASSVAPDQLREARPDQLEQLAMYCALSERRSGRLLTVTVADGRATAVQAVDVGLATPENVELEMRERAAAVRTAWAAQTPAGLPACRWFGRGCEFQEAGVCDCIGGEPDASPAILNEVRDVTERSEIAERLASRLKEIPEPVEAPLVERFRDLLYPRRTYFERTVPEDGPRPPPRSRVEPLDLFGRLTWAVEAGPLGEVTRLPPRSDEPEEEVAGFRGSPFLVRTSRGAARAAPGSLLERQPQYALELGFRCLAAGVSSAHLVLGRERAAEDPSRVQAFRFEFRPTSAVARVWRERRRLLAAAFREKDPAPLPACPDWMVADCPYRSECACGAVGMRSQR
jgi:hypothetical protein